MALFATAQNPNKKRKASLFSVLGGDALSQRQPLFGEQLPTSQLQVKNPVAPLTATTVKPLQPVQQPLANTPEGKALAERLKQPVPTIATQPPTDQPNVYSPKPTTEQTALGGGKPPSAVPTGETDASIQNPPQPTQPLNPADIYGQAGADYPIQPLIDYDTQFIANPPASVQSPTDKAAWDALVKTEMEYMQNQMKQYPDQFGKVFQDHRTRMESLKQQWETRGQYESKLQDMLNQAFPGTNVSVKNVPAAQQNAFYQQAIAALQAGKSPQEIAAIYKSMFPAGYDFTTQPINDALKENIDKYVGVSSPDINQSGATIDKTDTSKIGTEGQTQTGKEVTSLQIEELKKQLAAVPFTEEEKQKILAGDLQALDASKQAAIKTAISTIAASGFSGTPRALMSAIFQAATPYDTQAAKLRGDLTKQGIERADQIRQQAISELGQTAGRETTVAQTAQTGQIAGAEIGSKENIAAGQLQLAKDSLFQEGQLTASGQQINQQLQAYGFSLDKVLADQNFNLENFKNQLSERIANQTGNIEAAKLTADNITKSIQFAMDETQLDNQRNAQIAELQLRAAQGDQQAQLDVQQLEVEQELRSLGLENDYADRLGGWLMEIMTSREKLSAEREQFLLALAQQAKEAGANRTASLISNIVGGVLGGAGSIVGAFGGGQR